MLHACAARFDMTGNLQNFLELNKAAQKFWFLVTVALSFLCDKYYPITVFGYCSTFVFI